MILAGLRKVGVEELWGVAAWRGHQWGELRYGLRHDICSVSSLWCRSTNPYEHWICWCFIETWMIAFSKHICPNPILHGSEISAMILLQCLQKFFHCQSLPDIFRLSLLLLASSTETGLLQLEFSSTGKPSHHRVMLCPFFRPSQISSRSALPTTELPCTYPRSKSSLWCRQL